MQYGKENESKALEAFTELYVKDVDACGLFVDRPTQHPYLAASPDGLVRCENALVEVKCLSAAARENCASIEDAIDAGKVKNCKIGSDGTVELRPKSHWFSQIQGQLNITGRLTCYLILYTPAWIHVIIVKKDEKYWTEEMVPKLEKFYNGALLPEIVEPMLRKRGLPSDIRVLYSLPGLLVYNTSRSVSTTMAFSTFKTLSVTLPSDYVAHVELNRPEKRNAMNRNMWLEIGECFRELADSPDCRVVVLSGAGDKCFTAGLDFQDMLAFGGELSKHDDIARKARLGSKLIRMYQESMTALEKCPKPVIAAINGFCIGGGLNLICAADIRYCSKDAIFQNKEVAIGLAADVGTSQRMPRIIGSMSLMNELAFTAREMFADEAKGCGLVNRVFENKESLIKGALGVAETIAAMSPVAVQGTKKNIIFSRDHGVDAGLEHILTHNMTMTLSDDFIQAITSVATKGDPPTFSKL